MGISGFHFGLMRHHWPKCLGREVVLGGRFISGHVCATAIFILAGRCVRHLLTGYRLVEHYKPACDIPLDSYRRIISFYRNVVLTIICPRRA